MAEPLESIVGGKYEILGKLKEGGMGSIYRVRHRLLDEVRVIKVLKPHLALQEDLRLRFHNEAKAAIRLRHPNIAHLYDFSVDDRGHAYIVMEFIDGVTLQELLGKSGPPSLPLGLEIGQQCLQAIAYLHQSGFVHRDIAADNFMLTRDFQDDPLVKLIDLGIAKSEASEVDLTSPGTFMGKVRYSAPEQFKAGGGAANMDQRSDLYSFGVILYQLLTGTFPIRGESFSEVVAGHLFHPPLPFDETDPEGRVPEELRAIVLRSMEKSPADRFSTAEEVLEALSDLLESPGSRREEVTRTLKVTSELLAAEPPAKESGSTQDRLDRQFGLDETSSHREVEAAGEAALEPTRLAKAPVAAPAAAPESEARSARPPRVRASRRRWALAAALLLLAAAAGALWVFLRPLEGGRAGSGVDALRVAGAPSWSQGSGGPGADELRFPSAPPPPPPDGAEEAPTEDSPAGPSPGALPSPLEEAEPVQKKEPMGLPERVEPAAAQPRPVAPAGPVPLYTAGPGVTPPKLLQLPAAVLPQGVDRPGRDVAVLLAVLVDQTGKVVNATVKKAPAFRRRFKEAALGTAYRATFEPAVRDGRPGKMWTEIEVVFPGIELSGEG